MEKRKICYVSGTRADFGLMTTTLNLLNQRDEIDLSICVTGMHLSPVFGYTISEIEKQNFRICSRIIVNVEVDSETNIAKSLGQMIIGMTDAFDQEKPDLVLLLGDRGESLAAAIAALHLNIPIVHIHGGERSGTIDESFRHAISKLSHYHFVATEESRARLIKMGEQPETVIVTGAPGLDDISSICYSREDLCRKYNLNSEYPIAFFLFHPVHQETNNIKQDMSEIFDAIRKNSLQVLAMTPNSDSGRSVILEELTAFKNEYSRMFIMTHLQRDEYLALLSSVDVMIGNSSSGIIEAASLNLGVVNIGSRQKLRERNENVVDVECGRNEIDKAISTILKAGKRRWKNVYGDGKAGERITDHLARIPLTKNVIYKSNAY